MSAKQKNDEQRIYWLKTMLTIRFFEEKVEALYKDGTISGGSHSSAGQEATAVGACATLATGDRICTHFRGNGHCIAKGLELHRIAAELFGKSTGCCKGKGGAMHISAVDRGILPTSAIVGGGIPTATGSALSAKLFGSGQVTLCFFGDGASNQGVFHECLNLAAIWKLPVVYLCENNQYAMSMPVKSSMAIEHIAQRASAYGMEGVVVDGNDVEAVYEAVNMAVRRARSGEGPTLIECKTYRLRGHYIGDPVNYRSKEEVAAWQQRDPIRRYRERLLAEEVITDADYWRMEEEVAAKIEGAVRYAQESPLAAETELTTEVYA